MNEQETKLFVEDAKSILTQHKTSTKFYPKQGKISKSELVSALRNTRSCGAWFTPESKRGWKLDAYFINMELEEILEESGISIEHQRSKPNAAGNSTILRTYFSN